MSRFRAILLLAALLASSAPVDAATFVVDTVVDAVDASPGDGVCATAGAACSLRAAIQETRALAGADTITLPAGTYDLTIAGQNEDAALRGDLDIVGPLTLSGAGAATTIVDAHGLDRAFEVRGGGVSLGALTIRGGDSIACGGGLRNVGALTIDDAIVSGNNAVRGGGICNDPGPGATATLALTNVTVTGNFAQEGGGIANQTHSDINFPFNHGTATISLVQSLVAANAATGSGGGLLIHADLGLADVDSVGSTIRDNEAGVDGGGVRLVGTGIILIFTSAARFDAVDTTISGNRARDGGGVYGWVYTLTHSTVTDNEASRNGGGLYHYGELVDSTISGNRADGDGGGLYSGFGYELQGATITNNLADADSDGSGDGGGVWVPFDSSSEGVYPGTQMRDTIIAGNQDAGGESPDCTGELRSAGHNLLADPSGCLLGGDLTGNVVGLGAGLAPLASNGGATLTHALLPGSPALDAGAGCSPTDQRGIARPHGPGCDIGAVEQVYVATACGNGALDGGEACDDGNVRDGDCCSHLCQLESAGASCSDGDPCTDDTCDGAGTCLHAANTAPCTDGSVCTLGPEACAGGTCVPGPPRDCTDGKICTGDVCDSLNGCYNPALTGPACDDGNACTGSDACQVGFCRGTPTGAPCDDGNPCTDGDSCGSDHCFGTPNSAPCDDGDTCTGGDHCDSGSCQSGEPLACPATCEACIDGIGCTVAPRTDCRLPTQPAGAALQITDKANDKSDALQWRWRSAGGTTANELPAQFIYPDYELCVFDETASTPNLVLGARPSIGFCGNKPCWSAGSTFARYRDPSGAAGDGLTGMQFKVKAGKAQLKVKAKGTNLATPALPLVKDPGVVVELRRRSGACWSSRFETPTTNTPERFKAKSD